MQAQRPSSRAPYWLLLALGVSACKPAAGTSTPQTRLDDIASIEYELAANASRLEAQGLTVPAADPSTTAAGADDGATKDDYVEPTSPTAEEGAPAAPPPESEPGPEPSSSPVLDEDEAPSSESVNRDASDVRRMSRRERKKSRATSEPKTRCERICDLAESTCGLADRICDLADEHVDDVRYEQACERAEAQCELASDACSDCVE